MKTGDKQFAVIGLGRFGLAVCKELQDSGSQVLAVDINEDRVKEAAGFVSQAIVANCTHEETVAELKLDDYDMVMIAIGADVNASILATLIAKEAGVKSVWVKANDRFQARVLQKLVQTTSSCQSVIWVFVWRVRCWTNVCWSFIH